KVGEYLALGKPVISTDMPSMRRRVSDPDVITIARSDAQSFERAIEAALSAPSTVDAVARRRALAAQFDWTARLEALSDLIAAAPRAVPRSSASSARPGSSSPTLTRPARRNRLSADNAPHPSP